MIKAIPLLLLTCLMCGCAHRSTEVVTLVRTIRPGDRLLITLHRGQVIERRETVGPAGDISLPFVGKFVVAGMTSHQAQTAIKVAYGVACWPPALQVTVATAE
jgi:protein involved in polysaccharide export with SLBB domain